MSTLISDKFVHPFHVFHLCFFFYLDIQISTFFYFINLNLFLFFLSLILSPFSLFILNSSFLFPFAFHLFCLLLSLSLSGFFHDFLTSSSSQHSCSCFCSFFDVSFSSFHLTFPTFFSSLSPPPALFPLFFSYSSLSLSFFRPLSPSLLSSL